MCYSHLSKICRSTCNCKFFCDATIMGSVGQEGWSTGRLGLCKFTHVLAKTRHKSQHNTRSSANGKQLLVHMYNLHLSTLWAWVTVPVIYVSIQLQCNDCSQITSCQAIANLQHSCFAPRLVAANAAVTENINKSHHGETVGRMVGPHKVNQAA